MQRCDGEGGACCAGAGDGSKLGRRAHSAQWEKEVVSTPDGRRFVLHSFGFGVSPGCLTWRSLQCCILVYDRAFQLSPFVCIYVVCAQNGLNAIVTKCSLNVSWIMQSRLITRILMHYCEFLPVYLFVPGYYYNISPGALPRPGDNMFIPPAPLCLVCHVPWRPLTGWEWLRLSNARFQEQIHRPTHTPTMTSCLPRCPGAVRLSKVDPKLIPPLRLIQDMKIGAFVRGQTRICSVFQG